MFALALLLNTPVSLHLLFKLRRMPGDVEMKTCAHRLFALSSLTGNAGDTRALHTRTEHSVDRFFLDKLVDAMSTTQPEFRLIYCLLKF